jgi:hypothetical protein
MAEHWRHRSVFTALQSKGKGKSGTGIVVAVKRNKHFVPAKPGHPAVPPVSLHPTPAVLPVPLQPKAKKAKGSVSRILSAKAKAETPAPQSVEVQAWVNAGLEDDEAEEEEERGEAVVSGAEEPSAFDLLRAELLGLVVAESLKRQRLETEVEELKEKVAKLEQATPPWRYRTAPVADPTLPPTVELSPAPPVEPLLIPLKLES